MDTEEPNSVEKGAHRRKAPVPVRVCFAGGQATSARSAPANIRLQEEDKYRRAQLR